MSIDEVREDIRNLLVSKGIPPQGFKLGMVRKDESGNRVQDVHFTLTLPVCYVEEVNDIPSEKE